MNKQSLPPTADTQLVKFDVVEFRQFLSDALTAAGLLEHGKQSKGLAERLSTGAVRYMTAPERKPTIDWVSVEDRLPEAGGYYLATVDTDEGQHVDVLMFDLKQLNWIHEFEPTFCHNYLFAPTHWANRPEAAHNITGKA